MKAGVAKLTVFVVVLAIGEDLVVVVLLLVVLLRVHTQTSGKQILLQIAVRRQKVQHGSIEHGLDTVDHHKVMDRPIDPRTAGMVGEFDVLQIAGLSRHAGGHRRPSQRRRSGSSCSARGSGGSWCPPTTATTLVA